MKSLWSMLGSKILIGVLCLNMILPFHAYGIVCDGVDDVLTTGLDASVFGTVNSITMRLWIKPTGSATFELSGSPFEGQGIIGDDGGCFGLYRGTISGTDRLIAYGLNNGSDVVMVVSSFTNDTWIHLTFTQSATTLSLFVNGVSAGTASLSNPTYCGNLQVCKAYSSGEFFNGQVAEVETYTGVLSNMDILNKATSRIMGPLRAHGNVYWPLTECSDGASCNGTGFVDRTGNGRTLTASGTTGKATDYLSMQARD